MTTQPFIWRSPEALVEIAFSRSRIVMMNEAHDGFRRCIRTREIGRRILPTAHALGVRHLAMEALWSPELASTANTTRLAPSAPEGYLAQPEMKTFIQAALDLGWTLVAYEAALTQWLLERHSINLVTVTDPTQVAEILQDYQSEMLSQEFTNWREAQQARNLIEALDALPPATSLLVWCGNGHLTKAIIQDWQPMGYQFQTLSGLTPFVIDQTRLINFSSSNVSINEEIAKPFINELTTSGGTAGFLAEEAPSAFQNFIGVDAFLLSLQNDLE